MSSFLRGILPISSGKSKSEDPDDGYSADYSFAIEYKGPPISYAIPEVVPVDIVHIPTASVAATAAAMSKEFSLPVIQPIIRSRHPYRKPSAELNSGFDVTESHDLVGQRNSGELGATRVYSRKLENGSHSGGSLATLHNDQSSNSSGTLGFSDCRGDSNHLSESSDDECKARVLSCDNCSNSIMSPSKESTSRSQKLSSEIVSSNGGQPEDSVTEASGPRQVTFCDSPSSDANCEETDDGSSAFSEMPVVSNGGKKGLCHRCHKRNRFTAKEVCIVCCAKYCSKCVIRAMGSMPEGRKCITCIGCKIDESKRCSLGKCSRMLKRLFSDYGLEQIMNSEISCEANQLLPRLIWVNGKYLCKEELVLLQSCSNPPKKLRPGRYWYDKVSGFWGKEGEKPCQIISTGMTVGVQLMQNASKGDAKVMVNGREITRAERWMLKAAGIHCEGDPSFWLNSDGSYRHEGMNHTMGNLWTKKRVKIACAALSLPFPSGTPNPSSSEDADKGMDAAALKRVAQRELNKLLLVGCDQSGTATIFKQAKIFYKVPFTEDEKQNIKHVIQRNIYSYICVLLEGCARFEEEYLMEIRGLAEEPGPSEIFEQVEQSNTYTLRPNLKFFATWLLEIMKSGNLDVIFPAAIREYSPLVEQLWNDKAFQATYKRRNELHELPRVANNFLDRAVEISRADYVPSEMDILYADGMTSLNGVASTEFTRPNSPQEGYMESLDQNDFPIRYQLTRVPARNLGKNCKWLDMFEDANLVIYCVSLTEYDEYYEDINGDRKNKMLAAKEHFVTTVTHPALCNKTFLLILNKFDLLEEKIEQVPLSQCEWFQDFNPVISNHPHNPNSNNSPPLAQRAFHYIAVKFKRLFGSLNNRKLYVTRVTAQDADSVDKALRYSRDILNWHDEICMSSKNECSSASTEPSTYV